MRFSEVLEMWLHEKKEYVKASTYAFYEFEVNQYIKPELGNFLVQNISEELIQKTVLRWQSHGKCEGQSLKKSTVQNLVMLIKQVLKYAVKKKLINDSLIEIHFAPQNLDKKQQVFTIDEQSQIIRAVLDELTYKTFGILLCINSGLRIGELCALKWSDIDLENNTIHISKTLQRIYLQDAKPRTQIIITTPKTETSIRDIPISERVISVIHKLGNINPDAYVLTNTKRFIEPRSLRRFYTNFLREHDIKDLHFHCLRHTFATRCIENGADYKCVSEILGHTTITTTLNMYVHPRIEEKRRCVDLINWG